MKLKMRINSFHNFLFDEAHTIKQEIIRTVFFSFVSNILETLLFVLSFFVIKTSYSRMVTSIVLKKDSSSLSFCFYCCLAAVFFCDKRDESYMIIYGAERNIE